MLDVFSEATKLEEHRLVPDRQKINEMNMQYIELC